jgi:NAD-dependent DNA ligase
MTKEEAEGLDELSHDTLRRYRMKSKSIADNEGPLNYREKGRELAGRKSYGGRMAGIEKAKVITLSRFIYALSISGVGEETSDDLAQHFNSIEILSKASLEELSMLTSHPVLLRRYLHYLRGVLRTHLISQGRHASKNQLETIRIFSEYFF